MNRRSFFATLFGGVLCKFLPKPKSSTQAEADWINRHFSTRVDTLDMSKWGRLQNEYVYGFSHPELYKAELESGLRWHAEGNLPTAYIPRVGDVIFEQPLYGIKYFQGTQNFDGLKRS